MGQLSSKYFSEVPSGYEKPGRCACSPFGVPSASSARKFAKFKSLSLTIASLTLSCVRLGRGRRDNAEPIVGSVLIPGEVQL